MERDQIVSKVVVFCPFFEVVLSGGKVEDVKKVLNAAALLLKLVHLAHSKQSFQPQARFHEVIAINSATLLGLVSQVLLPKLQSRCRPLYIIIENFC